MTDIDVFKMNNIPLPVGVNSDINLGNDQFLNKYAPNREGKRAYRPEIIKKSVGPEAIRRAINLLGGHAEDVNERQWKKIAEEIDGTQEGEVIEELAEIYHKAEESKAPYWVKDIVQGVFALSENDLDKLSQFGIEISQPVKTLAQRGRDVIKGWIGEGEGKISASVFTTVFGSGSLSKEGESVETRPIKRQPTY